MRGDGQDVITAPVLDGARLTLRPVTLEDAPALQDRFNDWEIIKNLSTLVPWPYPPDGAYRFIAERCLPAMETGDEYVWIIALKEVPHDALGIVHFRRKPPTPAHGHRGFWIARPHQGKGHMTESVALTNDFLFDTLGINWFTVCNVASNRGSHRVKNKTGARFVDYIDLAHHSGETHTERWIMTRESWHEARKTLKYRA